MLEKLKSALAAMKRNTRIGLVVSIVWLVAVMAFRIDEADVLLWEPYLHHEFDVGEFLSSYLIVGVLPVVLFWGIVWIRGSK